MKTYRKSNKRLLQVTMFDISSHILAVGTGKNPLALGQKYKNTVGITLYSKTALYLSRV